LYERVGAAEVASVFSNAFTQALSERCPGHAPEIAG
jgi:hypothetical protein